ncbi:hypothetical protein GZH47_28105 [Paenibacillus rhizovicinus]|uniref:Uncharacterized protein n=1 Tax=Paenibacillus rhizovicinus TaxID=2704463 RepID=A0A6C0P6Y8_9BACL|nr:DUF5979 domain-containing protein [Paenibacillus rhizovicinus]QHW34279.1 hypothetical protein GZH47_28105 [Paenibacillus rhizovicinus]
MKLKTVFMWLLTIALVIGAVPPSGGLDAWAAGNADKSGALTGLTAIVKQGNAVIPEGGTIDLANGDELSVEVSFGVPVAGDDPTPPTVVEQNDTASFTLSEGFTLTSGTTLPLQFNGKLVGTTTLNTTGTNTVTAETLFDGDADLFDETGGYYGVQGKINVGLKYDSSGAAGDEGTHQVQILGKTYTIVVPPQPIVYNVVKSGTADLTSKVIHWTVQLTGTKGATAVDLNGYVFSDDLSGVGAYVANTFQVDGVSATPVETGSLLTYTLDAAASVRTVTFDTAIPDDMYYRNHEAKSVSNTVNLLKDNAPVKDGTGTVTYTTPTWIEKTGAPKHANPGSDPAYDPDDQYITWTITANKSQASLDELTLTDALQTGLDFVSAQWQTSTDGTIWTNDGASITVAPADGNYTRSGTTNTMVRLVITSKVHDNGTDITVFKKTFNNAATLDWAGKPSGATMSTGNVGVGIGYDALTKTGVLDKPNRVITWTVKADAKNQPIADMSTYDLIVYDGSTNLSGTTGWPAGISEANLTKRTGLRYVAGSGTTSAGALNVIPIMKNGQQVADLIEVTGLSTTAVNTMTFKTLIVDPEVYAGNSDKNVNNTASLFTGTNRLRDATGTVTYQSRTLAKELLKREAMAAPAAGVNAQRTTNANEGFDYDDKSVIFRLSVNADGLNFNTANVASNEGNDTLGTASVNDTLPAGWEFEDIVPGQKYLIFEGTAGSGSSVNAASTTPTPEASVTGLTSNFGTAGQAVFTFAQLDKPYVILVKAKPTDAALAGYFESNETSTITNNLNLQAANWTPGTSKSQQVSIHSEILNKSHSLPANGTLIWTIVYNPNQIGTSGQTIVDTLPLGLDLRTDSTGALLLDDGHGVNYLTATELTLEPDGSLVDGAAVTLSPGGNLIYDNATRELTFNIPDYNKAYRLTYLTDITGEVGTIVNYAILSQGDANTSKQEIQYAISNADSSATLLRGGWLEVAKTNGTTAAPLAGAEFTLYAEDGSTIIRKAVSSADGKLRMKAIPAGTYVLRETAAPAGGYALEGIDHTVSVDTSGPTVVTSIDGKTGADANKLAVANYLTNTTGKLVISKTVAGNDGDLAKKFNFTVTFTDAPGVYDYTGTGGAASGTIASGGTISLAHGQSIIIAGLPADAQYTVTETDYANDGYKTTSLGATGEIAVDETQTAAFLNTKDKPGNLIISKTVTGNDGDQSQTFDFTITLNTAGVYNYTGTGGAGNGTITSGDKISLAGGQSITIAGLPAGTTYTVAEDDYAATGYATTKTGDTGTIVTDDFQSAQFVNARDDWFGSLKIGKSVKGNAGDKARTFDFTVNLSAAGVFNYTGAGGAANGTIASGDTFPLADGQSITIAGLPRGTTYKVVEASYAADGYATTKTGESGAIVGAQEQTATFVNTKNVWYSADEGHLTISKTVSGPDADLTKKFSFTVDLNGAPGTYAYSGSGGSGTIRSGGTVALAHGEAITIAGLPLGTSYTVVEADYSAEGYTTTDTGASGVFNSTGTQSAAFVNVYEAKKPEQPTPGGEDGGSKDNTGGEDGGKDNGSKDNMSGEDGGKDNGNQDDKGGEDGGKDNGSKDNTGGKSDGGGQQPGSGNGGSSGGAGDKSTDGSTGGRTIATGSGGKTDHKVQTGKDGTPKTGDRNDRQIGQFGLIFFGAALAALIVANVISRRRIGRKRY